MQKGSTWIERERIRAEERNKKPGVLGDYDCPECLNRGFFHRVRENGERYCEECKCMAIRRNIRYMRESGLGEMIERYSFSAWKCKERWQEIVLQQTLAYARDPDGWLFVSGRTGTGKTHICTAVCAELMKKGYKTRYLLWRDFTTAAKAALTDDDAYQEIMEPFKSAKVLYIDDFLKTGKGGEPTTGDVNLAFELLNYRYNSANKVTIISSELTIDRILDIDEALGSRIYQRSRGHYIDLSKKKNYRLEDDHAD